MAKRILLVDDDALLRRSLAFNLEQAGYVTLTAANAEDALAIARRDPPDLVLLDIGLPGMDGLDALRHLKEMLDLPVIFLTARRRELDEVVGLELGADDYITKPFSPREVVARVKAVLRRSNRSPEAGGILQLGELRLDPDTHTVMLRDQSIELTPTEFDMLKLLLSQPGRVFTRLQLLEAAQGMSYEGYERSVDVHVKNLRHKLKEVDPDVTYIETVFGVGYRAAPIEE
jgi:DNA-binding response OmpR family regulator